MKSGATFHKKLYRKLKFLCELDQMQQKRLFVQLNFGPLTYLAIQPWHQFFKKFNSFFSGVWAKSCLVFYTLTTMIGPTSAWKRPPPTTAAATTWWRRRSDPSPNRRSTPSRRTSQRRHNRPSWVTWTRHRWRRGWSVGRHPHHWAVSSRRNRGSQSEGRAQRWVQLWSHGQ